MYKSLVGNVLYEIRSKTKGKATKLEKLDHRVVIGWGGPIRRNEFQRIRRLDRFLYPRGGNNVTGYSR